MQYEHMCTACKKEFELEYKISDPVPTICPLCNVEGQVKRLISWSSGRVELSGHELKEHFKNEQRKAREEVKHSESLRANIMGESAFNQYKLNQDKRSREKF